MGIEQYTLEKTFHNAYERLKAKEREYEVTIRVLAVVTARLLEYTRADGLVISDEQIAHHPEIKAWRDEEHGEVHVEVVR